MERKDSTPYKYITEYLKLNTFYINPCYKTPTPIYKLEIAYEYKPEYNHGVLLKQSNVFVIDCDLEEDTSINNGVLQWVDLFKKYNYHHILNDTFSVMSSSGGMHFYYQVNDQSAKILKNRTKIMLESGKTNIDIRADTVVAPGSYTIKTDKQSEGYYKIINYGDKQCPIMDLPDEIINEIYKYNFEEPDIIESDKTFDDNINLDLFLELLNIIDVKYIDNRLDWVKLIWSIVSLGKKCEVDLTDKIHELSKRSSKYDDKATQREINNAIKDYDGRITYKLIPYRAKQSDLNKFNEIYKKYSRLNKEIDLSESGLAESFYDIQGVNYIYQNDMLYVYDNNEWILDNKAEVSNHNIRTTLIDCLTDEILKLDKNIKNIEPDDREELNKLNKKRAGFVKYIMKLKTNKFTNDLVKQLKYILKKFNKEIEFDTGEDQYNNMNFKNGVFELKNNRFRKRTYTDYVTKILDYDYIEYNKIDPKIHKEVYNFFVKLQPDKQQRDFTLGYLAYSLTGDTGKQIFKINVGYRGSNGKSSEVSIHSKVFDIYTVKLEKNTFTLGNTKKHKSLMSLLTNPIRLCFIEELDQKKLDGDFLKDFVSGDKITLEKLYGLDVSKNIQAKLMTCSNKDLILDGDGGILRRGKVQFYNSRFMDVKEDDYINHIYIRKENFDKMFDNIYYKNAYFHLLLKYINDLIIPKDATDNFISIVEESNPMLNDFNDKFTITNSTNDFESKQYITEMLPNYKWLEVLTMLKNKGLNYNKDMCINYQKGFVVGVKRVD